MQQPLSVSHLLQIHPSLSVDCYLLRPALMRLVAYKLYLLNFIMAMKLMFLQSNLLNFYLSVLTLPVSFPSHLACSFLARNFCQLFFWGWAHKFLLWMHIFSPALVAISLPLADGLFLFYSSCLFRTRNCCLYSGVSMCVCGLNMRLSWWPSLVRLMCIWQLFGNMFRGNSFLPACHHKYFPQIWNVVWHKLNRQQRLNK